MTPTTFRTSALALAAAFALAACGNDVTPSSSGVAGQRSAAPQARDAKQVAVPVQMVEQTVAHSPYSEDFDKAKQAIPHEEPKDEADRASD